MQIKWGDLGENRHQKISRKLHNRAHGLPIQDFQGYGNED